MYVMVNEQGNVLVEEYDIPSNTSHFFFADLGTIIAINTYSTKDITIKKFFPWSSPKSNNCRLIKKKIWFKNQKNNFTFRNS